MTAAEQVKYVLDKIHTNTLSDEALCELQKVLNEKLGEVKISMIHRKHLRTHFTSSKKNADS